MRDRRAVRSRDALERTDQRGPKLAKFLRVDQGQLLQNPPAFGSGAKDDAAAVLRIVTAEEQTLRHGTIYQLNRAVVTKGEALGGISDGRPGARGRPCHLEQQLMLLRM